MVSVLVEGVANFGNKVVAHLLTWPLADEKVQYSL